MVGTTFFERFLTTMDYPHDRLVLRPRSAAVRRLLKTSASGAHDTIVPCYLVGDHFVIAPAAVNDAPGLFLFDSGLAGGGVMPSNALIEAAKIPVDRARATTGLGGGGAVTAIPFVAQRVSVGMALQRDVKGVYTPQGSPFSLFPFVVWGAISHEFLKHYAFTMDFDAMKIVLQAPQAVVSAPTAQQIFDAAFRRLQSYPAPPYAVWTSTWHITRTPMGYYTGESSSVEVIAMRCASPTRMENVSDPIPSGKLPPALIEPEFLGPFAWTIRSSVHVAPAQSGAPMMVPDMAGLMTIAHVVSVAKWPYSLSGSATGAPDSGSAPGTGRRPSDLSFPVASPRRSAKTQLTRSVDRREHLRHLEGSLRRHLSAGAAGAGQPHRGNGRFSERTRLLGRYPRALDLRKLANSLYVRRAEQRDRVARNAARLALRCRRVSQAPSRRRTRLSGAIAGALAQR